MNRTFVVFLLSAGSACAQSGIHPPLAGVVNSKANMLRPVFGLGGNFVLGDGLLTGVVSAAFGDGYGLAKIERSLVVLGPQGGVSCELPAPEGAALFALAARSPETLAYLPQASQMVRLRGCAVAPEYFDPPAAGGEILSMAMPQSESGQVAMVVKRDATYWLLRAVLSTGLILREVPLLAVAEPLYLSRDGTLVFARDGELIVRAPDGTERRQALDAPVRSFADMGAGWLHLVEVGAGESPGRNFALRLFSDSEQLYRLPEVAP